jgi:hypothetical protein
MRKIVPEMHGAASGTAAGGQEQARMASARRWIWAFAVTCALTGTARADDIPAVTAKLCAAAAEISSFVMQAQMKGTTGVTMRVTYVRPARLKTEMTMGTMSVQSYIVDGTAYVHTPMGWQKTTLDDAKSAVASMNLADLLKSTKVTYLPDRREDGLLVGVMQVAVPSPLFGRPAPAASNAGPAAPTPAATPQVTTCSFDRTTYRMRNCSNDFMTMTYSNYNDPANIVDLPAEAKSASPLALPSPAATDEGAAPAATRSATP